MIGNIPKNVDDYVTEVLKLYLQLPETPTKANSNDKITAIGFNERNIPMSTVESAFLLASVRRLGRSPDLPPLSPIRSLAYFLPVIQEILNNPISDDYLKYLQVKIRSLCSRNRTMAKCS
jgi:hypothetical protein